MATGNRDSEPGQPPSNTERKIAPNSPADTVATRTPVADPVAGTPPDTEAEGFLEEDSKCLLSEFDRRGLRWLYNLKRPGVRLALIFFGWALVTVMVGHFGRANGMGLTIMTKVSVNTQADSEAATKPATERQKIEFDAPWHLTYGFLAEGNFGFYFLLIAPIFVFLGFEFVRSAVAALSKFQRLGTLRPRKMIASAVDAAPGKLESSLRRKNAKWLWPTLFAPPLITVICLANQFGSIRDKANRGYYADNIWDIGHVQSPYLYKWKKFFDNQKTELERFDVLDDSFHRGRDSKAQDVADAVLQKAIQIGVVRPNMRGPLDSYVTFGSQKDSFATAFRLRDAVKDGFCSFSMSVDGQQRSVSGTAVPTLNFPFLLYVVMSQIEVALLWATALWICAKMTFVLAEVYTMLPNAYVRGEFEFAPSCSDDERRYGLGDLFWVYDLMLSMVALGALYVGLQYRTQTSLAIIRDSANGTGLSRGLNIGLILVVLSLVVLFPMVRFASALNRWRGQKLKTLHLDHLHAKEARDDDRASKIHADIRKCEEQRTWPLKDHAFIGAAGAIFALLIWPAAVHLAPVTKDLTTFTSIPPMIQNTCHYLTRSLYFQDGETGTGRTKGAN